MSVPPPEYPPPGYGAAPTGLPGCVRHPDRRTGLSCTRCGRPACPECLHEASVGYQCVDCVREGRRTTRRATTVAGAEMNTRPLIVPLLILVNVAVFAFTVYEAGSLNGNNASPLFTAWALSPDFVSGGEPWRIVTAGFLHFGPIHLVLNMLALWVLGRDLEVVLGKVRFVALYLLSLLGGGLAVFVFDENNAIVAGASGAVFGLMGGIVVAILRMKLDARQALAIIAINIVLSFTIDGISLLGHLGGLVVGALVTVGLVYPPPAQRTVIQVGTVLGVLAALLAVFFVRDAQLGWEVCQFVDAVNYQCR